MVQLAQQWADEHLTEREVRERLDQLPADLLSVSEYDPALDWSAIVARWRGQRVMTGLRDLDRMAGGLMPGTFIVIGGRTSHGKTAMLVHLSVAFAEAGIDTEIVTLEEPHEAITRRAVATRSGVSIRRLTDGQMIGNEFPRSEEAVRWLQEQPWRVTGVEHLRSSDEDAVVGLVSSSTARCVLVDHLQKITTRDESRQYGIERVTNRLQAIALRDGKLLIVGAQLGRGMDDPPRRPRLNDLRDSGAIEQAARQVWLLYWPSRHKPEMDGRLYELGIAKHSDGPSGWLNLRFDAVCGRFLDA
jgi:replicative DNA helicase